LRRHRGGYRLVTVVRAAPLRLLPRIARRRLRGRFRVIVQTAVAAVAAWGIAALAGVEPRPVFASIAAVICVSATFGERRRITVQLVGGVVLGIAVADLLVLTIGTGLPQVGLLVLLAMTAAVVVGGGDLLVSEAAVSAVLLAALPTSAAPTRLFEALIGGGVALAVHALVLPPDPIMAVTRGVSAVFDEVGRALRHAAVALAGPDPRSGEDARSEARTAADELHAFGEALVTAEETARFAPARRRARGEVARHRRTFEHLERLIAETRLFSRDVARFTRTGRPAPDELNEAVRDLASAAFEVPTQFQEPWRSGDVAVLALGALSHAAMVAERHPDVAVREIAGHARSVAIDIARASEAVEDERGALTETPTEELAVVSATTPPPRAPAPGA
jgi:uncharacterized membrane protein YgaE (UPF0421/DUF939 family)